ncbi:SDR family oxidoreductase [Deinococcus maricopensis]|uniref:NAD-dependent epimerase/dehydratase n=1 Tax=Deinococcus maricopensis (strain DSM 21211 / LMG 22137 / NRRL B-23946 / LB-34) TaxID=709986 RepID=E8U549_DEIML|nr:SDR family oxidoreductase [Deinococcus maricopensis]ADV66188.1 NAD-dependent epimerase/dehydratase [Deinococcus maricopensis DSM 21211]
MRILVLGGTQFVGRHIVLTLLARGHHVTTFTRGRTPDDLPEQVERLHGDRNADLSALADGSWDACVDVSAYTPQQVRAVGDALQGRVGRYAFISTISVYADFSRGPITEDARLHEPPAPDVQTVTGETYGPLKVACEHEALRAFGDRATILRPDIVAGPFDHTERYTTWVRRVATGGPMLAPGDGRADVQVIDARDLAEFTALTLEQDTPGVFNVVGPHLTWSAFLDTLAQATGVTPDLQWVPDAVLQAHDVTSQELPLYIAPDSGFAALMNVSHDRALAAGLTLRDPLVTARDTLAWANAHPVHITPLTPERERALLSAARP